VGKYKVAISALVGVTAALVMGGGYAVAAYAHVHIDPQALMVAAAIMAFASTVTILTFAVLNKPEKKRPKRTRPLSELDVGDFAHFPTGGLRIVLRSDTVIEELDVMQNPAGYQAKDVMLTLKKSAGKSEYNPVKILALLEKLRGMQNFLHILLLNEHDEYVGYIPAAYVRMKLLGASAPLDLIKKYFIDVLKEPHSSYILREINGLSIDECVFDNETVNGALKKVSAGLFRGLVVFRNKRNRKPVGVAYEEDLIKLDMAD
jgi:hypothetical protein